MTSSVAGDPIRFIVGFLVLICVLAVVIIGAQWLASLIGWVIPRPLMAILGILLFLLMLLWLLDRSGYYHF